MLPTLDTVSFDDALPLSLHTRGEYGPKLARETRLALRVISAAPAGSDGGDAQLLRLEAKLDLALELALFGRHPETPACRACRLGLTEIVWLQDEAASIGDALLRLSPNPDSALTLFLPVSVRATPQDGRTLVRTQLAHTFDEATRDAWEKWVFRRHREAIRQLS
ncbi:PilZ domain-containing protein [Crenobacter caeni]|uniref:Cyclic di-GMP receptor atypical PilZ domain-containing protein n=1 Tax=Crenobacter caeni TaxID=2705474 RepID=A0A6B2KUX1_9NEIS|nr:PilZ domain-containing protein [Crenobacter caeni]NDV13904.1 hypothetical protein [Crenobacter caeni]